MYPFIGFSLLILKVSTSKPMNEVCAMIDYQMFDVPNIVEKMLGYPVVYLTDAVKSGKLVELSFTFNVTKDANGVPVKVQHSVTESWKEDK